MNRNVSSVETFAIIVFADNMFVFELCCGIHLHYLLVAVILNKWSCEKRKGHKPTGKLA